jgi:hypothetical protein
MSRYATRFNKRDTNEPEILAALAKVGGHWVEGPPLDGWAVTDRMFTPVEIKMPGEPFTDGQREFIYACVTHNWPYWVWRSVEDMLRDVGSK